MELVLCEQLIGIGYDLANPDLPLNLQTLVKGVRMGYAVIGIHSKYH